MPSVEIMGDDKTIIMTLRKENPPGSERRFESAASVVHRILTEAGYVTEK